MTMQHDLIRTASTLLIALSLCSVASAAVWRTGEHIQITSQEVIRDDLYVSGSDVRIEGTVTGDLIVAAKTLTVAGDVRGNLWAAGKTILLGGQVLQSAHLAAADIRVESGAKIGRDLLAAGSHIVVNPGAAIGRDVALGANLAQLNGQIGRDAYLGASGIEIGGVVNGNAHLSVGSSNLLLPGEPGLRFTPGGSVAGDLNLQSSVRPAFPSGAVGGQVRYTPLTLNTGASLTAHPNRFAQFLSSFITIMITALLLIRFARQLLMRVSASLHAAPAASLGYGALAFFSLPIAALLGASAVALVGILLTLAQLVTLGLPLALFGGPALLGITGVIAWLALLATQAFVAFVIGNWALHVLQSGTVWKPLTAALVGAVVLAALHQVPGLGFLLTLAALFLGLGALWLTLRGSPRGAASSPVILPQAT